MARQKSVQSLSGSLGGLVFYTNKLYGPTVRTKGGATKEQIKNNAEFEGVRRNNLEFGRASSYAKTIRHAFYFLEKHCKEGTMHTNLGVRIRELLLLDTIHEWGLRDLDAKALHEFRHFELDVKSLSQGHVNAGFIRYVGK